MSLITYSALNNHTSYLLEEVGLHLLLRSNLRLKPLFEPCPIDRPYRVIPQLLKYLRRLQALFIKYWIILFITQYNIKSEDNVYFKQ